jgi:hypothetical protein
LELFTYFDSSAASLGHQRELVKRLCRVGETLLSRPGQGAGWRLPIAVHPAISTAQQ